METIIAVIVTGILCNVCFLNGVKTAQMVEEDKIVELPKISPIKAIREQIEYRENKREQDKLETIMQNIEAYDGTSNHQKDIPR